VGLDAVFDCADDRRDALRILRCPQRHPAQTPGVGLENDGVAS
jgi:hypothetical protein